jgi:hypothetical protein
MMRSQRWKTAAGVPVWAGEIVEREQPERGNL